MNPRFAGQLLLVESASWASESRSSATAWFVKHHLALCLCFAARSVRAFCDGARTSSPFTSVQHADRGSPLGGGAVSVIAVCFVRCSYEKAVLCSSSWRSKVVILTVLLDTNPLVGSASRFFLGNYADFLSKTAGFYAGKFWQFWKPPRSPPTQKYPPESLVWCFLMQFCTVCEQWLEHRIVFLMIKATFWGLTLLKISKFWGPKKSDCGSEFSRKKNSNFLVSENPIFGCFPLIYLIKFPIIKNSRFLGVGGFLPAPFFSRRRSLKNSRSGEKPPNLDALFRLCSWRYFIQRPLLSSLVRLWIIQSWIYFTNEKINDFIPHEM